MPGADHFLPVWLLHVIKEAYHTAIDARNFTRHHPRYGPKEIRGTRDETEKTRDPTEGGDPESLHHVRIPGQPLHVPYVQEDQPIPMSEILFK